MKHLFGVALLLFVVANCFTEEINFMGIPLGTSQEKTLQMTRQNNDITYYGTKNNQVFYTGRFAGYQTSFICFTFFENKLSGVYIVIMPSNYNFLPTYDKLRSLYIKKYGSPTGEERFFYNPFQEGDGNEETAIQNNKARITSMWDINNKRILVDCRNDGIFISYLFLELIEKEKMNDSKKAQDDI